MLCIIGYISDMSGVTLYDSAKKFLVHAAPLVDLVPKFPSACVWLELSGALFRCLFPRVDHADS